MTEASSRAQSPVDDAVERLVRRYADDPLKHRLLMRLYGAGSSRTLTDLAEPLRVHPSRARKSLRTLVLDGLVTEQGAGRTATYALFASPGVRTVITELLRRAIESGGTNSSSGPNG